MDIVDKKINDIKQDLHLNSKFNYILNSDLNIKCNVLNQDFYLDSLNYFPITEDNITFSEIFSWGNGEKYLNFYSKNFKDNFNSKKNDFKILSDVFVLGSSYFDNYYRNIFTFLPRIFFNKNKKIKLALHRNSSNKLRDFISLLGKQMKIEIKFIFLDDNFYKFKNSQLPQFLNKFDSIKILNNLKINNDNLKKEKLYIRRQNCFFRNLINESDVIKILKNLGYRIINLNSLDIIQQIKLFSNAESIVSASGSGLANLVFCNPGVNVYEISPIYKFNYEEKLKSRFQDISNYLQLNYKRIEADSIDVDLNKIDKKIVNTISSKVLDESNYYKNLLIKLEKIKEFIKN